MAAFYLAGPPPSCARSNSAPMRRPAPGQQQQQYEDESDQRGRNFVHENKLGAGAPARQPRAEKVGDMGCAKPTRMQLCV